MGEVSIQISVDTGGTFTDCVYLTKDGLRVLKVPSTPADPGAALLNAVRQIAGDQTPQVRHGTTVGTNALLERKGARVAFVTTAGFEDTIAIGRQARPKLYDLFFQKPEPLVPPELCFGIRERVGPDGTILTPITAAELRRLRDRVAEAKPEAIAVSLLFAFANPRHEQAVCEALRCLSLPISASHKILPEFREYERASTIVINAYLAPKMQTYLGELDKQLDLTVMQSSGGIIPASLAACEPVRTILSGPAGGVVGAMHVAAAAGFTRILTFDMGGTSTDVCLVDAAHGLETTTESQIQGMPVAVPVLGIHTVGSGGGSLASFDAGGALKVGPESAGAVPGPACYGCGTQPTVTDANLVLGRIDPESFLGGGMKLDCRRARESLSNARLSVEIFAEGIVTLANSHMTQALRKISVEQGYDPRDFTLVSFGGAGPLHGCELAKALQIPRILIPNLPGALSAFGILISDLTREYSKTVMVTPGHPAIAEYGPHSLDMRYKGQGYELRVPYTAEYVDGFHRLHQQRYGYADERRQVEVVNVRRREIIKTEKPAMPRFDLRPGDGKQAIIRAARIFADREWHPSTIYARQKLQAGDSLAGPAVITEYSATTYLPPNATARVDEWLNLIMEIHS